MLASIRFQVAQPPAGFFRTLRDYYAAYDTEYIADIVLDIMAPLRKWLSTDFILDKVEWTQHAVFEILKQIQNINPTPSELVLLRCTAAQYYSMNDGSDCPRQSKSRSNNA